MGCNTSKETATNQNEKTKNEGGDDGKERDGVVEEKHVETGKFIPIPVTVLANKSLKRNVGGI